MIVGGKIRLVPTEEQEFLFKKFCDVARFAYNESLSFKISKYKDEGYSCSVQDLIVHLQELKYSGNYDWLKEVPESVTKQAIKDLDFAYKMFFKRDNKGFPKFKSKNRSKLSFYQRTDKFRIVDETHIKITGIKGYVRFKGNLLTDKPKNPRITYDGKFWYFSYSFEFQEDEPVSEGEIIGIDLGVKTLAVCSDGTIYDNINKTSNNIKALKKRKRHLQRKLSKKYTVNGSYNKTSNIIKLEQQIRLIDRKLRNIRDTYIHTVTMDIVRTKPYAVVIEDLNVSGMMRNKHLSKAIQEQELYKFRQYIGYKCQLYGSRLIIANRFYASSKICSCCGNKKKLLSLSERTYRCDNCGKVIDRDLNASINLENYGRRELAKII